MLSFGVSAEDVLGCSQALLNGQLLVIAGQLAIDPDGRFLHPDDLVAQTAVTFDNLDRVLAHFGAGRHQVTETTVMIRELPQHLAEFARLHRQYFGSHRPASTVFGVAALPMAGQLVQISATACVPTVPSSPALPNPGTGGAVD